MMCTVKTHHLFFGLTPPLLHRLSPFVWIIYFSFLGCLITCLPQLVCMHGLPASDPAPLWKPEISCFFFFFLVMLYDQYTLLPSNKHDSTNPLLWFPPPPHLSPVSVFSFNHIQAVFHLVLPLCGRVVALWDTRKTVHLLQPLLLSGSFSFPHPYPQLLFNVVRFREERSLHSQRSAGGLHKDF